MKSLGSGIFDKLKSRASNIVTAWKITRTDGFEIGFTSGDTEFVYSGLTYSPANAFSPTAVKSGSNFSVDNVNTFALINESITKKDLLSGKWDNAEVQFFWVDPQAPQVGIVPLRGGKFGNITLKGNVFEVELRTAAQTLQQPFGKFYTLECRAELGDHECKVITNPRTWTPSTYYVAGIYKDAGYGDVVRPTTPNGFWYKVINAPTTINYQTFLNSSLSTAISEALTASFIRILGVGVVFEVGGNTSGSRIFFDGRGYGSIADIIDAVGVEAIYPYIVSADKEGSDSQKNVEVIGQANVTVKYGQSGSTEPTWPTTLGATITVGSLTYLTVRALETTGEVTGIYGHANCTGVLFRPDLYADGYFTYGVMEWLTGENSGVRTEIHRHSKVGADNFELLEAMPYAIQVGDTFKVLAGCDKTRTTCRTKFDNLFNHRGFPDLPTEDRALATPSYSQQGQQKKQDSGGS